MNKKILLIGLGAMLLFTGCSDKNAGAATQPSAMMQTDGENLTNSNNSVDQSQESSTQSATGSTTGEKAAGEGSGETGTGEATPAKTEGTVKIGESFQDPFVEGQFLYTVNKGEAYTNLTQAGLKTEDLHHPYNLYASDEVKQNFNEIADYIAADGSVAETHQLLILDITVKNVDAVAIDIENEFNINNLTLLGVSPENHYNAAYFSEWGKANTEQPLHYTLEPGNEINLRVGYLVLKDDVDRQDVVGLINDLQFEVIG